MSNNVTNNNGGYWGCLVGSVFIAGTLLFTTAGLRDAIDRNTEAIDALRVEVAAHGECEIEDEQP